MVIRFLKYGSGPKSGPDWQWKPHVQHNGKLDDLRTGFEIGKGYRIGHVTKVNFQDAVGQGGLFRQSLRMN